MVNDVHFRTDDEVAPGFHTKKMSNGADKSGRMDNVVFAVGMVVTVRHGKDDNNAQVIEYRDNLSGPIAAKASGVDNVIEILGQTVVVDNAAFFDSLKVNDVVEVSGFVDNAGRIRADFVSPASRPAKGFEVKGFVSALSGNSFQLGPLPGDSGATVTVSYSSAAISGLPGGPEKGMYVQVSTTDREPVGGVITATEIVKLTARTEFPEGHRSISRGSSPRHGAVPETTSSSPWKGKRVGVDGQYGFRWRHANQYPGTQQESSGSGDGNRRGSLRRQHNFPVGTRTATMRTAKCVERRNNDERTLKEEESAMRTPERTFRNFTWLVLALMISAALAACGGGGGGSTGSTSPGASGPATVGVSIASAPAFPAGTTFATSTASPVTAAAPANSPSFDNVFVTVTKVALIPSTGPEFPDPNGELESSSAAEGNGFVTATLPSPVEIDLLNLSGDNAAMLLNKFTGVPAGEYSKIRVYYSSVVGHNAGPPPTDTVFHQTANFHFDVHFVGGNLVIPVTSDPQGGIRFFSVVIDVVGLKYHEAGKQRERSAASPGLRQGGRRPEIHRHRRSGPGKPCERNICRKGGQ